MGEKHDAFVAGYTEAMGFVCSTLEKLAVIVEEQRAGVTEEGVRQLVACFTDLTTVVREAKEKKDE